MLHQAPTTALVVGLGGGATPGAVARYNVDVDVVELSAAVVAGSDFFKDINFDLLSRPNVHLHVDDGRNFMMMGRKKYDVITADIILPRHAGAGALYSKEYYELVRDSLAEGGLAMQWNGGDSMTEYKLLMRTFLSVFPYTTLWGDGSLMLGSMKPFTLSQSAYEARRQGFDLFNWDLPTLKRIYIAGTDDIRAFVGEGPILTDDKPVIEYFLSLPKDDAPGGYTGPRGRVREDPDAVGSLAGLRRGGSWGSALRAFVGLGAHAPRGARRLRAPRGDHRTRHTFHGIAAPDTCPTDHSAARRLASPSVPTRHSARVRYTRAGARRVDHTRPPPGTPTRCSGSGTSLCGTDVRIPPRCWQELSTPLGGAVKKARTFSSRGRALRVRRWTLDEEVVGALPGDQRVVREHEGRGSKSGATLGVALRRSGARRSALRLRSGARAPRGARGSLGLACELASRSSFAGPRHRRNPARAPMPASRESKSELVLDREPDLVRIPNVADSDTCGSSSVAAVDARSTISLAASAENSLLLAAAGAEVFDQHDSSDATLERTRGRGRDGAATYRPRRARRRRAASPKSERQRATLTRRVSAESDEAAEPRVPGASAARDPHEARKRRVPRARKPRVPGASASERPLRAARPRAPLPVEFGSPGERGFHNRRRRAVQLQQRNRVSGRRRAWRQSIVERQPFGADRIGEVARAGTRRAAARPVPRRGWRPAPGDVGRGRSRGSAPAGPPRPRRSVRPRWFPGTVHRTGTDAAAPIRSP